MAGQLTGKKYDQCAINQQTSQFTNQNHFMDLNRYVNCNNPSHINPSSLVGVESCLRGTDRKLSDCNTGTLNCLMDGPNGFYQDRYQHPRPTDSGLPNPQGSPCAPVPEFTWPADGKANIATMLQGSAPSPQSPPAPSVQDLAPRQGVQNLAPSPSQGIQSLAPIGRQVQQAAAPVGQQIQQTVAPIGRQAQQVAAPIGQQIQQGLQQLFGGNKQASSNGLSGLFSGIFGGVAGGRAAAPAQFGTQNLQTTPVTQIRPQNGVSTTYSPYNGGMGTTNVHSPDHTRLGNSNVYAPPNTMLGNANIYSPPNTALGTSNLQPAYAGMNETTFAPFTRQ